jgi:hypothetical protein
MFPSQRENATVIEEIFSTRSVPRCYNEDKIAVAVTGALGLSRCELLLLETGSWGRGQFRNIEEGECPPLEAAIKQRQWRRDCGL